MSGLLGAVILFLTVVFALALGILAAYGTVTGILAAFVGHSRAGSSPSPVLIPTQTPASGD